jgi:hypothetical protein
MTLLGSMNSARAQLAAQSLWHAPMCVGGGMCGLPVTTTCASAACSALQKASRSSAGTEPAIAIEI